MVFRSDGGLSIGLVAVSFWGNDGRAVGRHAFDFLQQRKLTGAVLRCGVPVLNERRAWRDSLRTDRIAARAVAVGRGAIALLLKRRLSGGSRRAGAGSEDRLIRLLVSHSRPDWSSANRVAQVQQSITFFQRI